MTGMRLLKLMAVAAILILLVLMLGPFGGLEKSTGLSDKIGHIIAFAVITGSLAVLRPRWSLPVIACAAFATGVAVEIIQGQVGRDADVMDVAADMVGIALATFALMSAMAVRFRARIP